jgi:hypothetical protein
MKKFIEQFNEASAVGETTVELCGVCGGSGFKNDLNYCSCENGNLMRDFDRKHAMSVDEMIDHLSTKTGLNI